MTQKCLNNPPSNKEIEFKIKKLPTKKTPDLDGFPSKLFKNLKKI